MTTQNTTEIQSWTLTSPAGLRATVTNYGAILMSVETPDRNGQLGDVLLGFDRPGDYVGKNPSYFGAVCGRVANRINQGRFSLQGTDYQLTVNDAPHSLHGGIEGFDARVWETDATDEQVTFRLSSPDGDQGYPGALQAEVTYAWSGENELVIRYAATTDAVTPVNLTNHAYFNLGEPGSTIHDHVLCIQSGQYTPVDDTLIPTGEVIPVDSTPMDFRTPTAIGDRIEAAGGYDHNYVLESNDGSTWVVEVLHPATGRTLSMRTTEPGVQFYSGNFLDGTPGKAGVPYPKHSGFCLEAQHCPDSVNQPSFPPIWLNPGETYRQETAYRFGVNPA